MITKKNAAAVTVAALMGALGIGGLVSAHATAPAPAHTTVASTGGSDGDGEANPATEKDTTTQKSDGDGEANPATEKGTTTQKSDGDGETNDDAAAK